MKNANTCDDLVRMVSEIERKLAKLNEEEQDEYVVGLKTAYDETLEIIRQGKNFSELLDYDIEKRYPICVTSRKEKKVNEPRCPF